MGILTTVINEFAHPPFGALTRELIGTLTSTGNVHHLTRVRGPVNVDAFGIAWDVFSAPAGGGRTNRVVTSYEDTFIQFGVRYTDLSGHDFYGELANIREDGRYFLWAQALPTAVDVWVFPNFAVTMYWLLAL